MQLSMGATCHLKCAAAKHSQLACQHNPDSGMGDEVAFCRHEYSLHTATFGLTFHGKVLCFSLPQQHAF